MHCLKCIRAPSLLPHSPCIPVYMLLFQPAVECVRMAVPEMMTPACVPVQMATVEITVKVSPHGIYIVQ